MSNTPSPIPGKKSDQYPKTEVQFVVQGMLEMVGNIFVIWGIDPGQEGKNHPITLYGSKLIVKKLTPRIADKIAHFQVRLIRTAVSADPGQIERVGNITEYLGCRERDDQYPKK